MESLVEIIFCFCGINLTSCLLRSDNVEEDVGVICTLPTAEGEDHSISIRFVLLDIDLHCVIDLELLVWLD